MSKRVHINENQWDILDPKTNHGNIFEGLIKSYPSDKVSSYIMGRFSDFMVKARPRNVHGVEMVEVFIQGNKNLIVPIQNVMDYPCGYTLARIGKRDDEIKLIFEPKFQESLNDEIMENEFLIHVSPYYNREKILKNGFCPKFKNNMFKYNDRIYFFSNNTSIDDILFLSSSIASAKDSSKTKKLFDFYYVDPQELIRNNNVEFYKDAMMGNTIAYWTYDNIPPSCILTIKRMKLDENNEWKLIG